MNFVLQERKIQSAQRSLRRTHEQIVLQVGSHQQITQFQKSSNFNEPAQIYNRVQKSIIINKTDLKWNHLEHANQKQLDNQFPDRVIKGEQWAYDQIRRCYQKDEQTKEIKDAKKIQRIHQIHAQHQQKQDSNRQKQSASGLRKIVSTKSPTDFTISPQFHRLSQPKQEFKPEFTYELPEYRGFLMKNCNFVDQEQSPELIRHFSNSHLLPISVYHKPRLIEFRSVQNIKPDIINTMQEDFIKNQNDFQNEAIDEIDAFENKLAQSKLTNQGFSQIKQIENQMMQTTKGFMELRKLQKQSNQYEKILGKQLAMEQIKN